jgi:hypothetical protein
MTRAAIAIALFLSAGWFAGCDRPAGSGPSNSPAAPPPAEKKADVHIRTPGVNVDVEHRGEGDNKRTDVNVQRK